MNDILATNSVKTSNEISLALLSIKSDQDEFVACVHSRLKAFWWRVHQQDQRACQRMTEEIIVNVIEHCTLRDWTQAVEALSELMTDLSAQAKHRIGRCGMRYVQSVAMFDLLVAHMDPQLSAHSQQFIADIALSAPDGVLDHCLKRTQHVITVWPAIAQFAVAGGKFHNAMAVTPYLDDPNFVRMVIYACEYQNQEMLDTLYQDALQRDGVVKMMSLYGHGERTGLGEEGLALFHPFCQKLFLEHALRHELTHAKPSLARKI